MRAAREPILYAGFMRAVVTPIPALLAAVFVAVVLTSCGNSAPPAADTQSAKHNAADVTFAQKMIPHHQQALAMSAMVPSHTTNDDVIVMAKHIAADQQAQIDTLQGWLRAWGQPTPPTHMDHGGMAMDGMVDDATMAQLPTLKGAAFDDLWLRSMIQHHQGAVAMAEPETTQGENAMAVQMAKNIIDWQQLEIGRMNAILGVAQ
ncbi:MAG: hypothetical protein NVS4B6_21620 [Mycobacterium sp.]